MKRKSLFGFLIATIAVFTQSCDSDFNEIGSDMFGDDGFGFETYEVQNMEASMVNVGEVSTKNLPINSIGVYNDAVFGKTTAHFVTQLEMASTTEFTSVGANPVIDSVYVYIPFNSSVENTDSDGNVVYKLNNVYGDGTFTLNVFENGYFLRNFDPNNNLETQEYYSSDKKLFDDNKKGINGSRLNNSSKSIQNTNFKFSAEEIKLYKYDSAGDLVNDEENKPVIKERKKPGIWLDLDKDYFQNAFFANNKYQSLINNNVLRDYFKGLYFNVESNGAESALAQLQISGGEVVIIYKSDKVNAEGVNTRARNTIKFKIGYSTDSNSFATTVNLLENQHSVSYADALLATDPSKLWIKGNNGSIAAISLFGNNLNANGIPEELEAIKQKELLINQAVLTVYVDKQLMTNSVDFQPNRLLLYDLKNNKMLADYTNDASTGPTKNQYNGIIDATSENGMIKYRFRITEHINNLIKKDSTNFVLGLAVTDDISLTTLNTLKTPKTVYKTTIKKLPSGDVISPFGTVLNKPDFTGGNSRMKLDLYYTKKNN